MPFATSCSISIDNAGKGAASTGSTGASAEAMALALRAEPRRLPMARSLAGLVHGRKAIAAWAARRRP
jgi:hypothetical protein